MVNSAGDDRLAGGPLPISLVDQGRDAWLRRLAFRPTEFRPQNAGASTSNQPLHPAIRRDFMLLLTSLTDLIVEKSVRGGPIVRQRLTSLLGLIESVLMSLSVPRHHGIPFHDPEALSTFIRESSARLLESNRTLRSLEQENRQLLDECDLLHSHIDSLEHVIHQETEAVRQLEMSLSPLLQEDPDPGCLAPDVDFLVAHTMDPGMEQLVEEITAAGDPGRARHWGTTVDRPGEGLLLDLLAGDELLSRAADLCAQVEAALDRTEGTLAAGLGRSGPDGLVSLSLFAPAAGAADL
ncbi:hypothetical protein H696_01485 [Fonticula alba]|uniref:Uncharacterized protein n=1 Tax=Fonticula alba TaxID=691883 RepID=A0A058ZF18_FONAL|nr:hypothetical protein H696_01485 [Fonticula alba]KCV72077.1 hypothetical protein H696_01485 [Fonticula alba]|eukprot:XP_009493655.1 hypothetical protein H696_01485 [Fonticula alba]